MTQPAGWYDGGDGRKLFWTGSEWLTPSAAPAPGLGAATSVEPSYVKRKRRTLPGILLTLSAIGIGVAGFMPWVTLNVADLNVGKDWLGVAIKPSFDISNREDLRTILAIAALACLILAMCLLWSKARGWGPVLRILYGIPWLLSAAVCGFWWWVTNQKFSDLISGEDATGQVMGAIGDVAQTMGLVELQPALGLFVWSGAVILGFVGLLVPGSLYEVKVQRR